MHTKTREEGRNAVYEDVQRTLHDDVHARDDDAFRANLRVANAGRPGSLAGFAVFGPASQDAKQGLFISLR